MRANGRITWLAIAAMLALGGCGPSASATPEPTNTPEPTATEAATNTPVPVPTDTPVPAPQGATRSNPVELGKTWAVTTDDWKTVVGVQEVLLGADATARLKQINQFNDDPQPGNMQILVNVIVEVSGANVPDSLTKYDQSFWAVVANGRPFDGTTYGGMVMPEPEFEGEVIPPGAVEGWIFFEVPETTDLALVFLRSLDNGGFWFSLQ